MITTKTNNIKSLYLSTKDSLARAVGRIVPPKDIEDIVQETYVKVCQIDNDTTIQSPKAFLMTTARNLALDHIKRAESRLTISNDEGTDSVEDWLRAPSDDTFEQVAAREEFSYFCEAVRSLPVECRKVFVLKKVYGYSQREIAQALDLSESTVEKRVASGITKCRRFMRIQAKATHKTPNNGFHASNSSAAGGL